MLAGLSQWGLTRFGWVTVKRVFAITCTLGGRVLLIGFPARVRRRGGHPALYAVVIAAAERRPVIG